MYHACKKVHLKQQNGKQAQFVIHPRYKVKSEGDVVSIYKLINKTIQEEKFKKINNFWTLIKQKHVFHEVSGGSEQMIFLSPIFF